MPVCLSALPSGRAPEQQLSSGRFTQLSVKLTEAATYIVQVLLTPMSLTCSLQEGGIKTNQAPPPLVKEKSYAVGRSYYTDSGKVITMTTGDNTSNVALATGSFETTRQVSLTCTTDDVTTEGTLMTIHEVMTPTSPMERPHGVCDVVSNVISGGEPIGDGFRCLEVPGGAASTIPPLTPLLPQTSVVDKLRPTPSPGHQTGRTSPSTLVC